MMPPTIVLSLLKEPVKDELVSRDERHRILHEVCCIKYFKPPSLPQELRLPMQRYHNNSNANHGHSHSHPHNNNNNSNNNSNNSNNSNNRNSNNQNNQSDNQKQQNNQHGWEYNIISTVKSIYYLSITDLFIIIIIQLHSITFNSHSIWLDYRHQDLIFY